MIWLAWRQQRGQLIAFTAMALVIAVWMYITGHHEHSLWSQYLGAPCHDGKRIPLIDHARCLELVKSMNQGWLGTRLFAIVLGVFPPLLGLVLGSTAIARDIDQQTIRLMWTQSQSRLAWFAGKLVINVAALILVLVPLSVVSAWWVHADRYGSRLSSKAYFFSGQVDVAFAIFCFALAAALGIIIRRSGWTLAVGVLVAASAFASVQTFVRPELVGGEISILRAVPLRAGQPGGDNESGRAPSTAWVLRQGYEPRGIRRQPISTEQATDDNRLAICETSGGSTASCERKLNLQLVEVYIPDGKFWELQIREGLIYLGAAALLSGLALVGIRRMRS